WLARRPSRRRWRPPLPGSAGALSVCPCSIWSWLSSPFEAGPLRTDRYLLSSRQRLARSFGNHVRRDATLGRSARLTTSMIHRPVYSAGVAISLGGDVIARRSKPAVAVQPLRSIWRRAARAGDAGADPASCGRARDRRSS